MELVLDDEQNFTCRGCAECCRRFEIVVSDAEVKRYEAANAAAWFQDRAGAEPGAKTSPFEHIGPNFQRIRKRPDGICGFLSPGNRCRIHEELGAGAKPLTCQMFPFSFDPVGGTTRLSSSFCCPTIVRNDGHPLAAQKRELNSLAGKWRKTYEPADRPIEWLRDMPLDPNLLDDMRWVLRRVLDLHAPDFSLRRNVRRMAVLVEDWTRQRVMALERDRFSDYVNLTGEHAVASPSDPPAVRPRLAAFLFRGFFFASLVPWASRGRTLSGFGLRLRLLRLLFHAHGIGPSFGGMRFGRGLRTVLDIDAEPFFSPAYHVLRSGIESLGSGRRPVVEELSLAVSHLLVAEVLFLAREGSEGASPAWVNAIVDAHDVAHADPRSMLGRVLVALSAPPSSLHLLGARTIPRN
jgi:Fe-S-cluster containining protein